MLMELLQGAFQALGSAELRTPGATQDRAPLARDALQLGRLDGGDVPIQQALIAVPNAHHLQPEMVSHPDHGSHGGAHSRRVAPAGHDANALEFGGCHFGSSACRPSLTRATTDRQSGLYFIQSDPDLLLLLADGSAVYCSIGGGYAWAP